VRNKLFIIGAILLISAGFLAVRPDLSGGLNPAGLRWEGLFFFSGLFIIIVAIITKK
jgi:hypothetical protein